MADKKETPSTKAFLAIVEKVQKVIATQCVLKPKDEDGPSKGGGCDC
jgi:hypothetical protein